MLEHCAKTGSYTHRERERETPTDVQRLSLLCPGGSVSFRAEALFMLPSVSFV